MWIDEAVQYCEGITQVRYVPGSDVTIADGILYVGTDLNDVLRLVTVIGSTMVDEPRPWLAIVLSSYKGWSLLCDHLGVDRAHRIMTIGSNMLFLIRYSVAHILMAAGAFVLFREHGVFLKSIYKALRSTGIDLSGIESIDQLPSALESLFPPDVLASKALRRFINR